MKYQQRVISSILLLGFILGNYKGYVAIWNEDKPDPIQIFPLSVSSLPQNDQEALEKGIRAGNREKLNRLLEDYLS